MTLLQRLGRRLAHMCGLMVIDPTDIHAWTLRATECLELASHHASADRDYLEGKNDGRADALTWVCLEIKKANTTNELRCPQRRDT